MEEACRIFNDNFLMVMKTILLPFLIPRDTILLPTPNCDLDIWQPEFSPRKREAVYSVDGLSKQACFV